MSKSFSSFRHPLDISRHPSLEPEVKRALLASWASDRSAVRGKPSLRKAPRNGCLANIDDVLDALRSLDHNRSDRSPLNRVRRDSG